MWPGLAGSRHVTFLETEASGTRHTVVLVPYRLGCGLSVLGLASCYEELQWGAAVGSCRLGGIVYVYVLFWLPRRPPWTAYLHFRGSHAIDVSHLSFNFLLPSVSYLYGPWASLCTLGSSLDSLPSFSSQFFLLQAQSIFRPGTTGRGANLDVAFKPFLPITLEHLHYISKVTGI